MPRQIRFSLPCDTSLFTPLQLQPQALLRLTMSGWAHWVQAHLHSFRTLLSELRFGVVVAGIQIDYAPTPLGFFDSDTLDVQAGLRVRKQGALLQLRVEVGAPSAAPAAQVELVLVPLHIGDARSLAARPAPVPPPLLALFRPDEIEAGSPPRAVGGLVTEAAARPACGQWEGGFTLHRHLCEAADQWSFIEVPSLCAAGRETLALQGGAPRGGLTRPLRSLSAELRRPFYVFEEGLLHTVAHGDLDEVHFIHQLSAPGARHEGPHATIIERY